MDEPYCFIIHAGGDKARLAPILRRLLDAGIYLWIDDPYHPALGLTNHDIDGFKGYVVTGAKWKAQRNIALDKAASILYVASKLSSKRQEVLAEIAMANFLKDTTDRPYYPLFLSESDVDSAAPMVEGDHGFKAFVHTMQSNCSGISHRTTYNLTEHGNIQVALMIKKLQAIQDSARKPTPLHSITFDLAQASPLFADRAPQSQHIADLLRLRRHRPGGCLNLPVLLGADRDLPGQFINRQLPERILPKLLGIRKGHPERLQWRSNLVTDPDGEFERLMLEFEHLEPITDGVVIYSQPPPEDFRHPADFRSCLRFWCRFWSAVAPRVAEKAILPILDMRFVKRRFSISRTMLSERRWPFQALGERQIKSMIRDVNLEQEAVTLQPLAPLGRVTWHCVETWLDDEVAPVLGEAVTTRYREELRYVISGPGLFMQDWVRHAHAALGNLNEAQLDGQGTQRGNARWH